MFRSLKNRLKLAWDRRYYLLANTFSLEVPVHIISWLPDGFTVKKLGETGVNLAENFCGAEEAAWLIDTAKAAMQEHATDVIVNDVAETGGLGLFSSDEDPAILALLFRASFLQGIPYSHVCQILIARVSKAADPQAFQDYLAPHSVAIFLNEMPDHVGGETVFPDINLAVSARVGRAISWSYHSSGTQRLLTSHESLPLSDELTKWVVYIGFGDKPNYAVNDRTHGELLQARKGLPLNGSEPVPEGVWAPQDIDLLAVFGQEDKLKGLV